MDANRFMCEALLTECCPAFLPHVRQIDVFLELVAQDIEYVAYSSLAAQEQIM
jgi:hypothetical protein